MSGLEVLGQLRVRHSRTQLPVIMVTARSGGDDVVEAFRLGANDYVTKPIDFPVAVARIETHLSHKWAIEDLRDSEERYALAVRGANDGLWDWNLITNQVHWSPRWKSMLGYEDAEIGDDPEEWFKRVHPEDIGGVKEGLAAHLAHGTGHYESEHRILHRDETFRWVRCRGAAVRNRGWRGHPPGGLADRRHRCQAGGRAHRLAEPVPLRRPRGARDSSAPNVGASMSSRCSCSASIGSGSSTTASDRWRRIACSSRWPAGCSRVCGRPTS